MSEKRILLASVLKPVNDTRMFEKFGLSLCKLKSVRVHIAGYDAPQPLELPENLKLYPIFKFKRLSIDRAKAQLLYWNLLQKIKPDLIIVCTHELLLASILYKSLHKCRVIYDIQENYALNLLSQQHYGAVIKRLLATGVKLTEKMAAAATDHFLLAEKSYADELPYLKDRVTIIQNKFKPLINYPLPLTPVQLQPGTLKLVYTGTIATLYGVFEAVAFTERLHQLNAGVSLTIIGYCASNETLAELKRVIESKPYVKLIGGNKLVPHQLILKEIQKSDIGLMPYHDHESIFTCIPTKLYEYVGLGKTVLIQYNPIWENLIKDYNAGISIDFKNLDINNLLPVLLTNTFYQKGIPEAVFWGIEETKLLQVIQKHL